MTVCRDGVAADHDAAAVGRAPGRRATSRSTVDLGLGDGSGVVLGVDLGYGYIDENRTTS